MRTSSVVLAVASAASVLGAPLEKKANYDALPGGDSTILNYALTLEYLERTFYGQGLKNFTESDFCEYAGEVGEKFYKNLRVIYEDEKTHVEFLQKALGSSAIPEPSFSFPVTDAESFIGLAGILEGVGVSAYLGAAAVIADKAYVTPAGSILTVEARHASYIRAALRQKPFPAPFDTPLNFNQVFSLAAQFITGFAPGTPALPFKAFPELTVVPTRDSNGAVFEGAYKAAVEAKTVAQDADVYAVFFSGLETYYSKVAVSGADYVVADLPEGAKGQVYVVLSTANGKDTKVSDENTVAGVGILEIEDAGW
ncbi:ferritin ribonucleotide reductase-like protein [Colletotrichum tofieldiae]|uniref:Ferritin ribonucleotide reductase-like protein n=1 Tax=Colletotrichum tofieldiae TaxID=708197 RepID=A0A166UZ50_9PEZI|nr:ferritin ribonucleotide reductase-like protein [Colletotrichum tofieldiae]GKT55191.1 ferritin ribonucleotide reductase-like protein [Colletotrichum tofieldiae]GKT75524.1 ferritin ribonucleotide reductase-like protein [Colletotrichum tofieldiae]GKT83199.1 ferritin ribonucleotide reductase-like protein [Colletotrichum tofieldiae]